MSNIERHRPPSARRGWWGAVTIFCAIAVLGAAPIGQGCTCNPIEATREHAANLLLPVEQENALGRQMEAELARELAILPDPAIQDYVAEIGHQLVAAAGDEIPDGIEVRFTVVDDDSTINAFAIPGGHIYVYTGLLKAADNEAELASVLAHEIAHISERHVAERLVTAYGVQTIAAIVLGEDPGLLSQIVAQVVGTGTMLRNSRTAERESDEVGLATVVDAGFDPNGYVTFFGKLAASQGRTSRALDFISSHPDPEERVESARRRIEQLGGNVPTTTNAERYRRIVARL